MIAVEQKTVQHYDFPTPPPTGPLPKIPKATVIFDRLALGRPSTPPANKTGKYQLWPKLSSASTTGRRTPDLLDLKRNNTVNDLNSGATSEPRPLPRKDQFENVDSPTIPVFHPSHDRSKSDPSAALKSPPPDGRCQSPSNKPLPYHEDYNLSASLTALPTFPSGRISPFGMDLQDSNDNATNEEKEEATPPKVPPKNDSIPTRKPVPHKKENGRENNSLKTMKSSLFSRSNTVKRPATSQGRSSPSTTTFLQAAPVQEERPISPARPVRPTRLEALVGERPSASNENERTLNKPWMPPSSNGGERLTDHSVTPLIQIPAGSSIEMASASFSDSEITGLQNQVRDRSKTFGILKHSEVVALTEELQTLEKHCEYLRDTYTSLRAGRQRLHVRLITHLKSPNIPTFATKSILKQEESLYDLDRSIDDWATRLEVADGRRNRVQQKLMEHMVATMLIPERRDSSAESSPRHSPRTSDSEHIIRRNDVESIVIFADSDLHELFANIESEVDHMINPLYLQGSKNSFL